MRRHLDWEQRLQDFLASRSTTPFKWGVHDCCRFACAGMVAQGLPDPMAGLPEYRTSREAARVILALGENLETAARTLGRRAGLQEVPAAFGSRGLPVLGLVDAGESGVVPAIGIVGLSGSRAEFAGEVGLVWRPLGMCVAAWRLV